MNSARTHSMPPPPRSKPTRRSTPFSAHVRESRSPIRSPTSSSCSPSHIAASPPTFPFRDMDPAAAHLDVLVVQAVSSLATAASGVEAQDAIDHGAALVSGAEE